MINIYANIKAVRERKGLSQQQMADKLSIVVSGYGKIERGQTQITFERLSQISNIFQMQVVELIQYKGTDEEQAKENHLNKLIDENDRFALQVYQQEINQLVLTKVDGRALRYAEPVPFKELDDWDLMSIHESGITTEEEYISAGQPAQRFTPEGDQMAFEEIIDDLSIYWLFEKGLITDTRLIKHWDNFKSKDKPKFISSDFGGGTLTIKSEI